jgi:hypothetical protein
MVRIRIFKSRQARRLAVALTALCALSAGTSTALASNSPAATPGPWHEAMTRARAVDVTAALGASPLFTCPDRTICLFPSADFTGNYNGSPAVILPDDSPSGVWHTFGYVGASSPNPGSIHNNSGSSIWVYDHQAPVAGNNLNPECILAHSEAVLSNSFGHFELFYGDPQCSNQYTRPLP